MANPPYITDAAHRLYRDGGGMHGAEISMEMARAAVERLAPEGRFILYTGSAIIDGHDFVRASLEQIAASNNCQLRYWEIDPDVFGEERSEEHTSELQSLMRISYAVFCLKKQKIIIITHSTSTINNLSK